MFDLTCWVPPALNRVLETAEPTCKVAFHDQMVAFWLIVSWKTKLAGPYQR
jgi:hypothetical protein